MWTLLGRLALLFTGLCIIALGLYVGVWVMFIGGLVSIITQCQTQYPDALTIGIGAAKMLFCTVPMGFAWWLGCVVIGSMLFIFPGKQKSCVNKYGPTYFR